MSDQGQAMAFDALKRLLGIGAKSADRTEIGRSDLIDSEIDSLERDIQESLDYANTRKLEHELELPTPNMPEQFGKGGGIARADTVKTG